MSQYIGRRHYSPPTGGLNDRFAAPLIDLKEAAELINARINENGKLEKYPGYTEYGSAFPDDADSFIRMALNLRRGTTQDTLIVAAQDDGNTHASLKVDYKKTDGDGSFAYIGHTTGTATFTNGSTAVSGSGTAWLTHLKAGDKIKVTSHSDSVYAQISSVTNDTNLVLTANYTGASTGGMVAYIARIITHKDYIPQGVVFNNKAVIVNGTNEPMTYNNTTLDVIADTHFPNAAKFIEVHKNRCFVADTTNIYWTYVNDETTIDAASTEPVFPNDAGEIVGIKSFADSLIVVKNNGKLYQVIGNFDDSDIGTAQAIRRIDTGDDVGTIAGRTIVTVPGALYFMSNRGIYRLTRGGGLEKISHKIDNFIDSLYFGLGPSQAKSHRLTTKTQWDNGTHTGTLARTADHKLRAYRDSFTISDAHQGYMTSAVATDTSFNTHVVYLDSNDQKKIRYRKYLASDNSTDVNEIAYTETVTVEGLSCAVSASGLVGVVYTRHDGTGADRYWYYIERSGGTWSAPVLIYSENPYLSASTGCAVAFTSGNEPRAVACQGNGVGGLGITFMRKSSGTWTSYNGENGTQYIGASIHIDGSNIHVAAMQDNGVSSGNQTIRVITSTNDGVSYSQTESITALWPASRSPYGINISKTSGGNVKTGYVDPATGTFKVRNTTGGSTATFDSASTCVFKGYAVDYDDENFGYYLVDDASALDVEKVRFASGPTSVTNTANNAITTSCGNQSISRQTRVFSSIVYGTNAYEILVRRFAPRATYVSQEYSDSTLTAWGTYVVTDETVGGNTILHEVAVNTASPPSSYSTIVNNQIVDSDSTKHYLLIRLTFTMGAFAEPSVGTITANYTGSGVDAREPVAAFHDGDLFFACSMTSDTKNSWVILLDEENAAIKLTYPISVFCVYKNRLYGGRATNGDLLLLQEGYNHDGSAYSLDCQFKEDFLDLVEAEKDLGKVYVLYEVKGSGTLTVSWRKDNFATPGGASWTSETVDQTRAGFHDFTLGQRARSVQLRVQNSTLDNEVGVYDIVLSYKPLGLR